MKDGPRKVPVEDGLRTACAGLLPPCKDIGASKAIPPGGPAIRAIL